MFFVEDDNPFGFVSDENFSEDVVSNKPIQTFKVPLINKYADDIAKGFLHSYTSKKECLEEKDFGVHWFEVFLKWRGELETLAPEEYSMCGFNETTGFLMKQHLDRLIKWAETPDINMNREIEVKNTNSDNWDPQELTTPYRMFWNEVNSDIPNELVHQESAKRKISGKSSMGPGCCETVEGFKQFYSGEEKDRYFMLYDFLRSCQLFGKHTIKNLVANIDTPEDISFEIRTLEDFNAHKSEMLPLYKQSYLRCLLGAIVYIEYMTAVVISGYKNHDIDPEFKDCAAFEKAIHSNTYEMNPVPAIEAVFNYLFGYSNSDNYIIQYMTNLVWLPAREIQNKTFARGLSNLESVFLVYASHFSPYNFMLRNMLAETRFESYILKRTNKDTAVCKKCEIENQKMIERQKYRCKLLQVLTFGVENIEKTEAPEEILGTILSGKMPNDSIPKKLWILAVTVASFLYALKNLYGLEKAISIFKDDTYEWKPNDNTVAKLLIGKVPNFNTSNHISKLYLVAMKLIEKHPTRHSWEICNSRMMPFVTRTSFYEKHTVKAFELEQKFMKLVNYRLE